MCIVGAGPVGLRAAIELALLGAHETSGGSTQGGALGGKWYSAIGIKAIVSPSPEDNGGNLFQHQNGASNPVAEYTDVSIDLENIVYSRGDIQYDHDAKAP
ncbi:FAD/NAD(P)-binding domain [Phytophthora cactorum]|nr:FAD/NAD(P)-binding domain [Phytophthora cactorum]